MCFLDLWFCFFFFLTNPFVQDLKLSDLLPSSNLCSSSCSFISSWSDHKFIPMYWPKFTGKAETKRNRLNLKNRSRFTKSGGRTAVRAGPCFFLHETILYPKQIVKLNGSRFFRSDRTIRSGFQNLDQNKWIYFIQKKKVDLFS